MKPPNRPLPKSCRSPLSHFSPSTYSKSPRVGTGSGWTDIQASPLSRNVCGPGDAEQDVWEHVQTLTPQQRRSRACAIVARQREEVSGQRPAGSKVARGTRDERRWRRDRGEGATKAEEMEKNTARIKLPARTRLMLRGPFRHVCLRRCSAYGQKGEERMEREIQSNARWGELHLFLIFFFKLGSCTWESCLPEQNRTTEGHDRSFETRMCNSEALLRQRLAVPCVHLPLFHIQRISRRVRRHPLPSAVACSWPT